MWKEVEIKAWIHDPQAMEKKLTNLYGAPKNYHKLDKYYSAGNPEDHTKRFRLRKDNDDLWVTYKVKEKLGALEVNNEYEYGVTDAQAFDQMMSHLGYSVFLTKEKKGMKFTHNNFVLELSHVAPLGWFLEIETLLDNPAPHDIKDAEKNIHGLFANLGVPQKDFESRYFSDLLKEKGLYENLPKS